LAEKEDQNISKQPKPKKIQRSGTNSANPGVPKERKTRKRGLNQRIDHINTREAYERLWGKRGGIRKRVFMQSRGQASFFGKRQRREGGMKVVGPKGERKFPWKRES